MKLNVENMHYEIAIEIKIHPSNMTWEEGFALSRSWKPPVHP
jgi:hypothetical protein